MENTPLEKMEDFFNSRNEVYDKEHLAGIDGGMEGKKTAVSFLPKDAKDIIDFGIGTGLELGWIFKHSPNAVVTGVDVSEKMLERLLEKHGRQKIVIKKADYLEYEVEAESFDAALSIMSFHHYPHDVKEKLYKKIFNGLRAGGVYVECDYMLSEHEYEDPQKLEDHYFAEYARLKAEQGLAGGQEYHYDTPCTVQNQKNLLSAAGFGKVSEVWRKGNTVILVAEKQA